MVSVAARHVVPFLSLKEKEGCLGWDCFFYNRQTAHAFGAATTKAEKDGSFPEKMFLA